MQAKNNSLLLIARFAAIFLASGSVCLDRNDFIHMMITRLFGFRFFRQLVTNVFF